MRYVIIAILVYLVYLLLKSILRGTKGKKSRVKKEKQRPYDLDRIQEAEYREINKEQ